MERVELGFPLTDRRGRRSRTQPELLKNLLMKDSLASRCLSAYEFRQHLISHDLTGQGLIVHRQPGQRNSERLDENLKQGMDHAELVR